MRADCKQQLYTAQVKLQRKSPSCFSPSVYKQLPSDSLIMQQRHKEN